MGFQDLVEDQVLAVAQALHGGMLGVVIRGALRQGDAARGQEVPDTVEARLAVDVVEVVTLLVVVSVA